MIDRTQVIFLAVISDFIGAVALKERITPRARYAKIAARRESD